MSTVTCNISFEVSAAELGEVMAALGALKIKPDIKLLTSKINELQQEVDAASRHRMGKSSFDAELSRAFTVFGLAEIKKDDSLVESMSFEEFHKALHARFRQSRQSATL